MHNLLNSKPNPIGYILILTLHFLHCNLLRRKINMAAYRTGALLLPRTTLLRVFCTHGLSPVLLFQCHPHKQQCCIHTSSLLDRTWKTPCPIASRKISLLKTEGCIEMKTKSKLPLNAVFFPFLSLCIWLLWFYFLIKNLILYNVFFKALMEFRMELPTLHLITSYFYAEISPRTKPPINTVAQSHCSQCSCVVATLAFWWEIYHFFAEVTSSNVTQNTSGNVTGKVSKFEWFTYSFFKADCDHSPSSCPDFSLALSSHRVCK